MADFLATVEQYRATMNKTGEWDARRRHQAQAWMWLLIDFGLRHRFREHPGVAAALPELSQAVEAGTTTPAVAAHRLLNLLNRYF
jgi:LAO/AO transport system kinase